MLKHAALVTLISLALSSPVIAKPHHAHHDTAGKSHPALHAVAHKSRRDDHYAARKSHHADHYAARKSHDTERHAARKPRDVDHYAARASHPGITCEMVRAYVAQVGLGQALAMAKSAGISAVDEERARHCLANKI